MKCNLQDLLSQEKSKIANCGSLFEDFIIAIADPLSVVLEMMPAETYRKNPHDIVTSQV